MCAGKQRGSAKHEAISKGQILAQLLPSLPWDTITGMQLH